MGSASTLTRRAFPLEDPETFDTAKCLGRADVYRTAALPTDPVRRDLRAAELCSGCPILRDCAIRQRDAGIMGMVCAGVAVPENSNQRRAVAVAKARLDVVIRTGQLPPLSTKRVRTVSRPVAPRLLEASELLRCLRCKDLMRPRSTSRKCPSNVVTVPPGGRGLCSTCYRRSRDEGTLDRYEKRHRMSGRHTASSRPKNSRP
jgi:hypothetical protein